MSWLSEYITSPTHNWWVDNVWRPSWTRFTSMVYGIPAGFISVFEVISKYANDTTISSYMSQLNVPNWVPMAFAGVALIHYVAHGRD